MERPKFKISDINYANKYCSFVRSGNGIWLYQKYDNNGIPIYRESSDGAFRISNYNNKNIKSPKLVFRYDYLLQFFGLGDEPVRFMNIIVKP